MSEVTDIVVPILQRLLTDLGDVKPQIEALTDRIDAFEDYFTYTMGLTQQHTLDIRRLRTEIAAIKARLNGPEGQQKTIRGRYG
jgi:hypothetical protein